MRKILRNNSKSNQIHGRAEGRIGSITGLMDRNGNYLYCGDKVFYKGFTGRILYNKDCSKYQFLFRCIAFANEFDDDSCPVSYDIPADNGARMEITLIERWNKNV